MCATGANSKAEDGVGWDKKKEEEEEEEEAAGEQYHRRHLMARSSMTMRTRAASTERKTERATPSPSPRRPAARDREPGAARHAPRRGARQSPAPILRV
ncbi:unnamed protein product [Prorocentrum cordatum]|uniref:Uncharacterized protein n=1 Tax=Prorocentrum cordatum TaxID=2364126 RepID=A0ABN9RHC7_9DINO|nr:unnamed protein product [Polarella glacialis]